MERIRKQSVQVPVGLQDPSYDPQTYYQPPQYTYTEQTYAAQGYTNPSDYVAQGYASPNDYAAQGYYYTQDYTGQYAYQNAPYAVCDDSQYMDAWHKQRKWWLVLAIGELINAVLATIIDYYVFTAIGGPSFAGLCAIAPLSPVAVAIVALVVFIRKPKIRSKYGMTVHFIYRYPIFIKAIGIYIIIALCLEIVACIFAPSIAAVMKVIYAPFMGTHA
jgi:hypothetical protein